MAKDTTNADAISEDMATEALASSTQTEEGWEDVRVGMGRGWDFDKDGDLVGLYLGINEVPISEEKQQVNEDGSKRETARTHSFGLQDGSGEIVFVWGSYELDLAMTEIEVDDKVKLSFLGYENFSSDTGPRQVKRYRVQRAIAK